MWFSNIRHFSHAGFGATSRPGRSPPLASRYMHPITGWRSGMLQAAIQPLLELPVQFDHPRVVERQNLREQCAGHPPDRIDPEIAVQQPRPADAARTAAVRSRLCVDIEREPPLVRRPGKLVEAVR